MRPNQRSRTAEATAALRAAHQLLDGEPLLLVDPFAERLLGSAVAPALQPWVSARRRLRQRLARSLPSWVSRLPTGTRRVRAQVVVRSRYAEDQLEVALEQGVGQYVILAAGLDTFALRRADLADRLRVFEVDHPQTQAEKRRRIEAIDVPWPPHLDLVPIDFERTSLGQALAASAFDPSLPAFFSWLGVTYYLSREAILETLRFVAGLKPGTELVFDFWSEEEQRPADRALLQTLRFSVAGVGEQMISFFTPDSIDHLVSEAGLVIVEILDRPEVGRRYLNVRRDGLVMPDFSFLAKVRV